MSSTNVYLRDSAGHPSAPHPPFSHCASTERLEALRRYTVRALATSQLGGVQLHSRIDSRAPRSDARGTLRGCELFSAKTESTIEGTTSAARRSSSATRRFTPRVT